MSYGDRVVLRNIWQLLLQAAQAGNVKWHATAHNSFIASADGVSYEVSCRRDYDSLCDGETITLSVVSVHGSMDISLCHQEGSWREDAQVKELLEYLEKNVPAYRAYTPPPGGSSPTLHSAFESLMHRIRVNVPSEDDDLHHISPS